MLNRLVLRSSLSHYGMIIHSVVYIHISDLFCATSPSLMKYHTQLLTLLGDGSGHWTLSRVGTAEERMGIDREISTLEDKLREVNNWEERVKELDRLLSVEESSEEDGVVV